MVGAISRLDTSLTWGEGKTSASDGQRFLFPRKVIQRTYSPRFSDLHIRRWKRQLAKLAPDTLSSGLYCIVRSTGSEEAIYERKPLGV